MLVSQDFCSNKVADLNKPRLTAGGSDKDEA